jgi:cyclophilin family peptidyl-prolyl cis-trans isomerase
MDRRLQNLLLPNIHNCWDILCFPAPSPYMCVILPTVEKDFIAQSGDPTGTGHGGCSIYGQVHGDKHKYFEDEIHDRLRHKVCRPLIL